MIKEAVESERERRLRLFEDLGSDPSDIEPARLRELGIYGGAQGIWVDKSRTGSLHSAGVTVGILHTGRHYPDDLSEDGVIYHYPRTRRPAGRDEAEVQATRNALDLGIPIFVILPGRSSNASRSVELGWVVDFDDTARQFLILFGRVPPSYQSAAETDEPFQLEQDRRTRKSTVQSRVGQQKFRFQVLSQYGPKCAACDIRHPVLLKSAHIRGVADRGSDDWRNGIPLCPTHHDAFDAHLFGISPEGELIFRPGILANDIGIKQSEISTMKARPHPDALAWRWEVTQRAWQVTADASQKES